LEIHLGSRKTLLLSRDAIDVPSAKFGTLHFEGGLSEVTFTDSVDLWTIGEANRQVSIACIPNTNIAELVSQGFDLTTTTASLSQIAEGEDFRDRRPIFRNVRIRNPEFGSAFEELRFSLRTNPFDDRATIPRMVERVNVTTWPDYGDAAYGRAYPQVFGQPGVKDTTTFDTWGSPALYVDTSSSPRKFLVAGHECSLPATVKITNKASVSDSAGPYSVYTSTDGLGRTVSLIDVPTSGHSMVLDGDDDYVIMWETGGGIPNQEHTTHMHGAGDVLRYMLEYSGQVPTDSGRLEAAIPALNEIRLDFMIEEPVKVWDWLKSNLLKFLPASLGISGSGVYPIVWDRDMRRSDAVAEVDAARDQWERTSGMSTEFLDGDPITRFKISHSKNIATGTIQEYSILDAVRDASDPGTDENVYARISKSRYGVRELEESSVLLYRAASAFQILNFWSRIYGFPIYSVEYVAPIDWGWLRAGNVIRLTDSDLHIEDQAAIVQAIEWADADLIGFRLSWLEDLPRDSRETAT
jgi:hypothetical protein